MIICTVEGEYFAFYDENLFRFQLWCVTMYFSYLQEFVNQTVIIDISVTMKSYVIIK